MKIRTRLSIAFLLVGLAGVYFLADWMLDDLRPRYLAAMEESMVDTATILATLVEFQMDTNTIPIEPLRAALNIAGEKRLKATIYEYTKTEMNIRVYVADHKGIVLLDTDNGHDEGYDYSRWNDVALTLRGEYGARATHRIPNDPTSAVLYVAAPLRHDGDIVGVLSVGKPATSLSTFLETARREITVAGLVIALVIVFLSIAVSRWVFSPIERLTRYAKAIRDDQRVALPPLDQDEIGQLGAAFEEMRVALAGKQYVEDYVEALTHQLKSPVSAIRGTVELLQEDMGEVERSRFNANLRAESARLQDLIDRMLHLASLENRQDLRDTVTLDLVQLLRECVTRHGNGDTNIIVADTMLGELPLRGERFLLEQALDNLVQNAVDFAGSEGVVVLDLQRMDNEALVTVYNSGSQIPAYALDRIFDRFYSLPRPASGKKARDWASPLYAMWRSFTAETFPWKIMVMGCWRRSESVHHCNLLSPHPFLRFHQNFTWATCFVHLSFMTCIYPTDMTRATVQRVRIERSTNDAMYLAAGDEPGEPVCLRGGYGISLGRAERALSREDCR